MTAPNPARVLPLDGQAHVAAAREICETASLAHLEWLAKGGPDWLRPAAQAAVEVRKRYAQSEEANR